MALAYQDARAFTLLFLRDSFFESCSWPDSWSAMMCMGVLAGRSDLDSSLKTVFVHPLQHVSAAIEYQ